MTIQTKPVFYFIDGVTGENNLLNFIEPGNPPGLELTAILNVGSRSMTNLMTEVGRALNNAGEEEYTVTFNRDTRIVTISATDTFELLVSSGSNIGSDPFALLGFTGADRTGASTYDGDTAIGTEYLIQFPLQGFKDFDNNKEGVQSSLNESAAGIIEVVTFGDKRLMEMELTFITDDFKAKGNIVDNNPTGIQDARDFLDFIITKSDLEFMPDRTDRAIFDTVLLERTRKSRQGTAYELNELLSQNIENHFTTGRLTFREVE